MKKQNEVKKKNRGMPLKHLFNAFSKRSSNEKENEEKKKTNSGAIANGKAILMKIKRGSALEKDFVKTMSVHLEKNNVIESELYGKYDVKRGIILSRV